MAGWFPKLSKDRIQLAVISLLLLALIALAGIIIPGFLSPRHLFSITQEAALLGMLSIGQTVVILSGGIDLSVGPTIYLIDVIGARLMERERLLIPSLVCLLVGLLIGTANGVGIAWFRVPPIVMTLAMLVILTGAVYIYSGGCPAGGAAPLLRYLGVGKIGIVPVLTIIWISASFIAAIILHKTVFGRRVYAIGSNPSASYSSGINVKVTTFFIYSISSVMASVAGLLLLGYSGTPYISYKTGVGTEYTLLSIAAVIMGGTVFTGARGGVGRTIIGVLILRILFSMLVMLGITEAGKLLTQGIILILILALYNKIQG